MEQKPSVQELANISDLFVSSSNKEETGRTDLFEGRRGSSDQLEDGSEVEETVSVSKRIAYPSAKNVQEKIKRCLFKHLDEDYRICRVELRKTKNTSEPGTKKRTEEVIVIFLKDAPA
jgi:hypothetical protein